ncbi:MAG: hypothetical protein H6868_06590 [Rhodospirillales bacterium]|nr:hypothetical protein [Rhodospirillales bacterium]
MDEYISVRTELGQTFNGGAKEPYLTQEQRELLDIATQERVAAEQQLFEAVGMDADVSHAAALLRDAAKELAAARGDIQGGIVLTEPKDYAIDDGRKIVDKPAPRLGAPFPAAHA